jgi:SpoVK/Ycf46/Vps4 family AAA+-type ATPase
MKGHTGMDGSSALFELELPLPDSRLGAQANRLIGFGPRYERMRQDLRLLVDQNGLEQWSKKLYGTCVGLLDALLDRYPLAVFHGDVGTGKTATAEAAANALAKDLGKDAMLFKLSTCVRGSGNVGEMSTLINRAFDIVTKEAGKSKLSFLIIDEADSLAASRAGNQSHHEDKVAVNTLIQRIDDIRRFSGRVLVILCTNRYEALDPAVLRRAAHHEEFRRPDDAERLQILELDCDGLGLPAAVLGEVVKLTGPQGSYKLGYTFSDIRTRLLPEALARAYPSRKIGRDDLIEAVRRVAPSPSIQPRENSNGPPRSPDSHRGQRRPRDRRHEA